MTNSDTNEKSHIDLTPGQIVVLKSNPAVRGVIVGVIPGQPETRYSIFLDGKTQTFYASQIQVELPNTEHLQFVLRRWFHSYLTAVQLQHPSLSTLYSLNAARIDFIPYQFRPVLKFIRSDRPRLLIADSVGVGKTIEAGLILRELQARRDVRSVLIICPRPLVTERKWQREMQRFEERFVHVDGNTLRFCINEMDLEGVWPDQYQMMILPYSLLDEALLYGTGSQKRQKRQKGLLDLDPPPRFDLVIVDEAHHIRNPDTYSHKAVRFFCDHAEAVVFLTATPIQLGNHDLFVLLNTLRPDLIIDKESYEHMAEPNPYINQAIHLARSAQQGWATAANEALSQAASTSWGRAILRSNSEFNHIRTRLSLPEIAQEQRVALITGLESLHTFSGIINRTRRRDIGDFTIRKPETVVVPFTPSQQQLHDDLLAVQTDIFQQLHGDINIRFLMMTIRRQAASCLYGLAPLLQDILHRHVDELAWDEVDDRQNAPDAKAIEAIRAKIRAVLAQAQTLDAVDPKLAALHDVLRKKQELPNNKVMLFSSFRHTLSYLYEHLHADGFRVGVIHGATPDEERGVLRNRFVLPRQENEALDVLLFSEIGCEGLDYQFCDCIVNYDLPWNPMRIEQRIGRVDRNGQTSESVAIVNLITPGTVDADIYERCLLRIGVFHRELGGSEEILGEISQAISSIAENFALGEDERKEKLQQLAENKIRLLQEQETLEQKQFELFGIRLPEDHWKQELDQASSFWLTPAAIQNLVTVYLQKICENDQEFILGEKPLKTLRLSQEHRNSVLKDFQALSRQNTAIYREWETWLKGGSPHLAITFEARCATQHPHAAFLMPLHPLVKQAARAFEMNPRCITYLRAIEEILPVGRYPFVIYQWQMLGIREDVTLRPVAISEQVTAVLEKLLEKTQEDQATDNLLPDSATWNQIESLHHARWQHAREQHLHRTQELAQYRRESLSSSHTARMALLHEQLTQATDEKIQRMRQSQIAAAEADYARRLQDIDSAATQADITTQPVAYGVITIVRGTPDAK